MPHFCLKGQFPSRPRLGKFSKGAFTELATVLFVNSPSPYFFTGSSLNLSPQSVRQVLASAFTPFGMFVTFKATGNDAKKTGMRELGSKKAQPGEARGKYGSSRRASCAHCRAKKVRSSTKTLVFTDHRKVLCQGDGPSCARCTRLDIHCVPASKRGRVTQARGVSTRTRAASTSDDVGRARYVTGESEADVNLLAASELPSLPEIDMVLDWFSLDIPCESHEHGRGRTANSLGTESSPSSVPRSDQPTSSIGPQCTCIQDCLDMAPSLDEDKLRLRAWTFDDVLRYQKHVILSCLRPITCGICSMKPASYTVAMLLCERLAGTFACLCRRVKNTRILGSLHNPLYVSVILQAEDVPSHHYGVDKGDCNAALFSPQFREQYSGEEQYHMARVLVRVQLRNFQQLLVRISETGHVRDCEARKGKIAELSDGMKRLADEFEVGFGEILSLMDEGTVGVAS